MEKILGKERLRDLGFDIPIRGKLTARWAIMLNRIEEQLPSTSDVARADDIELQEITKNAASNTEHSSDLWQGSRMLILKISIFPSFRCACLFLD